MMPMLASEDTKIRTEVRVSKDDWWLQQKLDGHRLLMKVVDGQPIPLNRKGEVKLTVVPPKIVKEFERFPDGTWYFDGELIDDVYWLFDLVIDGAVHLDDPYSTRLAVLEGICDRWDMPDYVRLLPTARTTVEKDQLIAAVDKLDGEGWVVKHHACKYEPGKRSSEVLKLKRWHTADVIIRDTMVGGKENAELEICVKHDIHGKMITKPVGNCSLIGKPACVKGDVVEVKYLYVGANGRLYQPSLLKVRNDKSPNECRGEDFVHVNKEVATLG